MCPTTERDLADGVGPARALADAGAALSLGSDQHAVIDLFEEARGLELDERLISLQRGRFSTDELHAAMTAHAEHRLAGRRPARAGRAAPTSSRCGSTRVRTAGVDPDQVVFAATAADVDTVVVDGAVVVSDGHHRLGDVGQLLGYAIDPLWEAQ